jgi:hypothetical protein
VLDRLKTGTVSPLVTRVTNQVDWSTMGAMGHSTGGLVAIAACERDPRLRACINRDGGLVSPDREPFAEFVTRGITKPPVE